MVLKTLKGDGKDKGTDIAGFKPNKAMIDMAKGFTVKRGLSMLGNKFTKEQILAINKRLNKVKKKSS